MQAKLARVKILCELKFKRERQQRLNLSLASAQIEILNLDAGFSGGKI